MTATSISTIEIWGLSSGAHPSFVVHYDQTMGALAKRLCGCRLRGLK